LEINNSWSNSITPSFFKLRMKTFFFIIFGLSSLFAQDSSIKIIYKVTYQNEIETFKNVPQLREYFEYTMENDWKVQFELKLNQTGSSFKLKKNNLFDETNHKDRMMLSFIGAIGDVYNLNDSIYTNIKYLGKEIFEVQPKIGNWTIFEETKKIDGYLCYKATNVHKVVNKEKVFNHPVVAWFCPELPYQFVPNGYGNLPGLILELQVRNVVFGADKIEFTNLEPVDFTFLDYAKFYSPEKIIKLSTDFNPD